MGQFTVLIADAEERARSVLRERLAADGRLVVEAGTFGDALRGMTADVDLVLLDGGLPDVDPPEAIARLQEMAPDVPVLLMTSRPGAHQDDANGFTTAVPTPHAVYGWIAKPFRIDDVAALVEKAIETGRLRREVRELRGGLPADPDLGSLIGESAVMRPVRNLLIRAAAEWPAPLLIVGEAGTGKNLAARALHTQGRGAGWPFVTVACSASAEHSLESELFGPSPGIGQRPAGALQAARGGTLFLDEIGAVPQPLQERLARALQQPASSRDDGEVAPGVRLIAASTRRLDDDVESGRFSRALFDIIAATTVVLPPLRERAGDIPLLVGAFVERYACELRRPVRGATDEAIERLQQYDWPGNVRELKNVVERAVLLAEGDLLQPSDFEPLAARAGAQAFRLPPGGVSLEEVERQLLVQALERTGGNLTRAGHLLGINRDQVRYRMEKFGLKRWRESA